MKKYLIKIDKELFNEIFIRFYRNFYIRRNTQSSHKGYVTKISNLRQYKSLTYWNNLFNHLLINRLEGDIVECGVGNGQSLSYILFNLTYNAEHFGKKYIGFDSFEGFPETSIHDNSSRNVKKGEWNHVDEKYILSNLNDLGFADTDYKNIKFIKGFFENTFQKEYENIEKISLLHIDCDLYSSTKISLETWFNKVEKNGIIVFDEYLNSINSFPGAVKAIDDFLGEDKKKINICPFTKQYYLIKN
jgi:hypothetical protein